MSALVLIAIALALIPTIAIGGFIAAIWFADRLLSEEAED
jgi:uncharacterized protein YneF (UPF0154 family)